MESIAARSAGDRLANSMGSVTIRELSEYSTARDSHRVLPAAAAGRACRQMPTITSPAVNPRPAVCNLFSGMTGASGVVPSVSNPHINRKRVFGAGISLRIWAMDVSIAC